MLCAMGLYAQKQEPSYDPHYLIIKVDQNYSLKTSDQNVFDLNKFKKEHQGSKFSPFLKQQQKSGNPSALDGVFKIEFKEPQDIKSIIRSIENLGNVIYAEPVYLDYPLQIPNDPSANPTSGNQYYLTNINAYNAWDVSTSDTTITVGIIDTGYNPDHEDLQNIQYNNADPINGIDDDGNGFIDDFMGWDFADSDNEPIADQDDHGSHVAGISSAETGNAIGIAGVGFNARYVPVKIFQSSNGFSNNAYESIIYAADQGYDVINLSWGSINTFLQHRQDIINYAALEKDVVIVAAAGNTPDNLNFYPASYDNVLSVAASDQTDNKTSFSTYSYHVDLVAPGIDIYSTKDGSYGTDFGTSFASPMVAGAAALLRSHFPDWSAIQIMEQLRVTSDNVYDVGDNSNYDSLLGKGRLNIHSALTDSTSKSVRLSSLDINNGVGSYAYFGDSISILSGFTSYLSDISGLSVSISCNSEYVSFVNDHVEISNLDSLSEMVLSDIQFVLDENTPNNERLIFKIEYIADSTYSDFEFFELNTSPENIDFGEGNSQITVLPSGSLGYDDNDVDDGVGFSFNGERILDKIGLIAGLNGDSLVDNSIIAYSLTARSFDFETQEKVKFYKHPTADLHIEGTFNDNESNGSILGLKFEQKFYGWNDGEGANNIIVEYRITNTSEVDYDSLYFGILSDWDIEDSVTNAADWNFDQNLGFTTNSDSSKFAGVALLTYQSHYHKNIDITDDAGEFLDDNAKFDLISSKDSSTIFNANISQINSGLIQSLQSNQSEKIAFVISAATSYSALLDQIEQAKLDYQEIESAPRVSDYDNVCELTNYYLNPIDGTLHNYYSDAFGTSLIGSGDSLEVGPIAGDTIFFISNIDSTYESSIYGYSITAKSAIANFEMSNDTLLLGDSPTNEVFFTDLSSDVLSWDWDLGDGTITNIQNPSNAFNNPGTYDISLVIETSFGCIDTLTQQLLVAERNETPDVEDQTVCLGNTIQISPDNTNLIRVYRDSLANEVLFEGDVFTSESIEKDTVFYVSNAETGFESLRVPVEIHVSVINIEFSVEPDNTILNAASIIFNNNTDNSAAQEWLVDGNSVGTLVNQPYELPDNNDFTLTVNIENSLGCQESLDQEIILTESPMPAVSNQLVCKGTNVLIEPGNGSSFLFYGDSELTELIAKGESLEIENIQSDTTLYVQGIDNLIPGQEASLDITLIDFEINILTTPDSIILDGPQSVTLSSSNEDIESYSWYINDDLVSTNSNPILFFDTPGDYLITLIAENADGCIDESNLTYKVLLEEIITNSAEETDEYLIFPNPTTKHIKVAEGYKILRIVTSTGKEKGFKSADTGIVNLENFTPGIYYVFLEIDNKIDIQKLIILR